MEWPWLKASSLAAHQMYLAMGSFIALFGLISLFVKEKLYLTESLVATIFGIILGPHVGKVLVPMKWCEDNEDVFFTIFGEVARMVISMQVMAAGIGTPGGFLKNNKQSILMLLLPVMLIMWVISGLCVMLALGLGWRQSFIIAACITPTDPVLAMSVIKGKFAERYIPTRLRNLLAVESGANDGLGYPLMMLPLILMTSNNDIKHTMFEWFVEIWIWEILGSVILGILCGWAARFLLKHSIRLKLIDKESFLVFSIALTLFVSGLVALVNADDLLAVFIAGNAFAWGDDDLVDTSDESHINSVIDMIFNISFFVIFGAVFPWKQLINYEQPGRLFLAAILILIFRRLPCVMLLKPLIPTLQSRKEAFFAGWFGPMGVGAIFFAIQARQKLIKCDEMATTESKFIDQIFPVVSFIVISSIIIHGITVPLTNSSLKRRMRRKHKRDVKLAAQLKNLPGAIERQKNFETNRLGQSTIEKSSKIHADEYNNTDTLDSSGLAMIEYETGPDSMGAMMNNSSSDYVTIRKKEDFDPKNDEYVYLTDDEENRAHFTITSLPGNEESFPPLTHVIVPSSSEAFVMNTVSPCSKCGNCPPMAENENEDADCE